MFVFVNVVDVHSKDSRSDLPESRGDHQRLRETPNPDDVPSVCQPVAQRSEGWTGRSLGICAA